MVTFIVFSVLLIPILHLSARLNAIDFVCLFVDMNVLTTGMLDRGSLVLFTSLFTLTIILSCILVNDSSILWSILSSMANMLSWYVYYPACLPTTGHYLFLLHSPCWLLVYQPVPTIQWCAVSYNQMSSVCMGRYLALIELEILIRTWFLCLVSLMWYLACQMHQWLVGVLCFTGCPIGLFHTASFCLD